MIDFVLTDVKLVTWHAPYIFLPFTLAYTIVLGIATKYIRQKPLYSFLTFEDWKTPVIMIVLFFIFTGLFIAIAKLLDLCSNNSI